MSKKKSCLRLFENFDYFGVGMQFRIDKMPTYTSACGGIIFLIYFIIALAYVGFNFYSFAIRDNMTLIYTYKIQEDPVPINLTDDRVGIAFGVISDKNNSVVLNETLGYLDYTMSIVTVLDTHNKIKVLVPLRYCQESDFDRYDGTKFQELDIEKLLCPEIENPDYNYTLAGQPTDDFFQFIEFTVSIKPDKLDKIDEVKEFLIESQLKTVTYFLDTALNYDNYDDPIQDHINYVYNYLDSENYKKTDIFLANLYFGTDANILYNNMQDSYHTLMDTTRDYFHVMDDRRLYAKYSDDYLNLVRYYFKVSTKYIVYERTYMKITDFIANMSGIVSQGIIILMFIVNFINEKGSYQKVMNMSMKFKDSKYYKIVNMMDMFQDVDNIIPKEGEIFELEGAKKSFVVEEYKELPKNDNFQNQSANSNDNKKVIQILNINKSKDVSEIQMFEAQSNRSFKTNVIIKNKIIEEKSNNNKHNNDEIISNKTGLHLNSFQLLIVGLCGPRSKCCRLKQTKNKILEKGEEKILYYLDILTYIKKMMEFDTMKSLIISKENSRIFDFITNPAVVLNEKNSKNKNALVEENLNSVNSGEFGMENIVNICSDYKVLTQKEDKSKMEEKLLKLFNVELDNLAGDLHETDK